MLLDFLIFQIQGLGYIVVYFLTKFNHVSINYKFKNLICIQRNMIQKWKLVTLESNQGSS